MMGTESRLKIFMDIFDDLSREGKYLVDEKILINELTERRLFPEEEPVEVVWSALNCGIIYEPKAGFYSRT